MARMFDALAWLAALVCSTALNGQISDGAAAEHEHWRFVLELSAPTDTPRDEWRSDDLPFEVEFDAEAEACWIVNGPERIAVPVVVRDDSHWLLDLPHFDSRLELTPAGDSERPALWRGTWTKRRSARETAVVSVRAELSHGQRFEPVNGLSPSAAVVAGRWRVAFESSAVPAVGEFTAHDDQTVTGTFRTTTGDYRYLAGEFTRDRLRLSCFDGAHAFRFEARLDEKGALTDGIFRSGSWWSETWSAVRDEAATLPDARADAGLLSSAHVPFLSFPGVDGVWRPVWRPGHAAVVEVFGSWCPNCHDAAALLEDLHKRYGPRGLDVVGLAFELTGDFARDAVQVARFAQHTEVNYPLLLAGTADKARAAAALGVTDHIAAFPTTFFIDASGAITAIWSGFDGPATGASHTKMCEDVERLVMGLLESVEHAPLAARLAFERGEWLRPPLPPTKDFARSHFISKPAEVGLLELRTDLVLPGGVTKLSQKGPAAGATFEVAIDPRSRRPSGFESRLVARGNHLIAVADLAHRWPLAGESECDVLPQQGIAALDQVDPLLAAECAFALGLATGEFTRDAAPLLEAVLSSGDTWVRANAAAALARLGPVPGVSLRSVESALVAATQDPSPLVRREAAGALGSWRLAPDLLARWQGSSSPFDSALAQSYSAHSTR